MDKVPFEWQLICKRLISPNPGIPEGAPTPTELEVAQATEPFH